MAVEEDLLLAHLDLGRVQLNALDVELTTHGSLDLLLIRLHNRDDLLLLGDQRFLNHLHLAVELLSLELQALLGILILRLIHCLVDSALQLAEEPLLLLRFFLTALMRLNLTSQLLDGDL